MQIRVFRGVLAVVMSAVAVEVSGQPRSLTLSDVLTRAREQAPRILAARRTVDEARARLASASLRFTSNPELEAAVGPRRTSDGGAVDFEAGLRQTFEPGSRRTARIAGVTAVIDERTADADETMRVVLREAAVAFFEAVHGSERIRILTNSEQLAANVLQVADRRFRAGDVAILDVNIAKASLARVRADREAAGAASAAAIGFLRQLLGLDGPLTMEGSLSGAASPDVQSLLRAAAARPEVRALEAAVREAEADVQLGKSFGRPDYGVGARYQREGGDQILLGAFTVSLPVFASGQELRSTGSARAARLRFELEAVRARIEREVRTAAEVFDRRVEAVRILERDALPGLDENDTLASRSFEVGQIGLPDLLLLRREILETRLQHVDALLEAALARVERDASAAILR
jgi:outer membrane protein, heavy metal efflux system